MPDKNQMWITLSVDLAKSVFKFEQIGENNAEYVAEFIDKIFHKLKELELEGK